MRETKACTRCNVHLPATKEHFYSEKRSKSGLAAHCKNCHNNAVKKYREDNIIEVKERVKKYAERNKGKIKGYQSEYYRTNKEELSQKQKAWWESNPDKNKEYTQKYRSSHPDKVREQKKRWADENLEHHRISEQRRRAQKKSVKSDFSSLDWAECLNHFNHECAYCSSDGDLEQDHFIPFSFDGGYSKDNIVPACRSCNSSKGNREFYKWFKTRDSYSVERERKVVRYLEGAVDSLCGQLN